MNGLQTNHLRATRIHTHYNSFSKIMLLNDKINPYESFNFALGCKFVLLWQTVMLYSHVSEYNSFKIWKHISYGFLFIDEFINCMRKPLQKTTSRI